jgi:hypothetical protein
MASSATDRSTAPIRGADTPDTPLPAEAGSVGWCFKSLSLRLVAAQATSVHLSSDKGRDFKVFEL